MKSGLASEEVVQFYCSLVRSVLEYASPVWAGQPVYLNDVVESGQKREYYHSTLFSLSCHMKKRLFAQDCILCLSAALCRLFMQRHLPAWQVCVLSKLA